MGKTVRRNSRKMNGGNAKRNTKRIAKRSNAKRSNAKRSNRKYNRYIGGVINGHTKEILEFIKERLEGNTYNRDNYHKLFKKGHGMANYNLETSRNQFVIDRAETPGATDFQKKMAKKPMHRYPHTTKLIYEYLEKYTSPDLEDYILLLEKYEAKMLEARLLLEEVKTHSKHREWVEWCFNLNNKFYDSNGKDIIRTTDVGAALHFIRTIALPYIRRELSNTDAIDKDREYDIETIQELKEDIETIQKLKEDIGIFE